ncbi:unnamed protein product [Boreogadus saida]
MPEFSPVLVQDVGVRGHEPWVLTEEMRQKRCCCPAPVSEAPDRGNRSYGTTRTAASAPRTGREREYCHQWCKTARQTPRQTA